ncbi:DegT/DnrJ/EryC1/StrS family aminotransferase, partial [bacterium]|nr:DegT/DnrJ/EryC1/StrS family aminotransferase [bacterium]
IITTGGGGALCAKKQEDVKRAKHLSTQAKVDSVYFIHDEIGYNYRMTNLQAALGIAQLEQLEKFIDIKKNNYEQYKKEGLELLPFSSKIRSNYWFYSLVTNKRDELIKYMTQNNIQTRPIWKLIHTLKPYESSEAYKIEKAFEYYEKIVNIPCSTNLAQEDLKRVAEAIKRF